MLKNSYSENSYFAYWDEIKKELLGLVSPHDMFMWIDRISFYDFTPEKKILRLAVPNHFIKEGVINFKEQITNILSSISGYECFVEFVINTKEQENVFNESNGDITDSTSQNTPTLNSKKMVEKKSQKFNKSESFKENNFDDYSFESFVAGNSNKFALLTAKAVAEDPGIKYNPLFLWGESGSGKTHLLKSIEKYVKEHFLSKKILYVTSEQFTNDFVYYVYRINKPEQLRIKYRTLDVLLIDDVQFFAVGGNDGKGKTGTQEELFHIFNTLYDDKKQMVFSCDKPINEVKNLEKRLRGRFAMGLPCEIRSPDYELRVAILKTLSTDANINIKNDAIDYICSNFIGSIRELKGIFSFINEFSIQNKIDTITRDTAISEFKNIIVHDIYASPVSVDKIIQIVAEYYHLKPHNITGNDRTKSVALARQISMYISRKLTGLSSPQIGSHFGDKEHATVLYATKKIEALSNNDPKIRNDIETLIKKISN